MNEIVKYNNDLNRVVFKDFTDTELKIMFSIFSKMKNKELDSVSFTFDQLRNLTEEKKHYSAKEYAEMIDGMYSKIIKLSYRYNDGQDKAGEFNLFEGYERSISEETFTISVTPKFRYFFNALATEFTRFELTEFINLKGKYTKLLYRQLKQWRSVGHCSMLMKEIRELLDVPENYENKSIINRVIKPSVEKLRELDAFSTLEYEYSKKGNTIIRIKFNWVPENIPKKEKNETDELAKILGIKIEEAPEM